MNEMERNMAVPDLDDIPDAEESVYANSDSGMQIRKKLTQEMIQACYQCGVRLFGHPSDSFNQAIDEIVARTDMNRNSAVMYVYVVKNMLGGEVYKRAISEVATKSFFDNIYRDFGKDGLKKALCAARAHIDYRHQCGHIVDGLIALCTEYAAKYSL